MIIPEWQQAVERLQARWVASGSEQGLQVAVYWRGVPAVDAWAGETGMGKSVGPDTLFPVFSVTKGLTATLVHQAVEAGLLAYDRPIAADWPEFAAAGKAAITLRQVLNHSAGLPCLPRLPPDDVLRDRALLADALARRAPDFPPGARAEYHAITMGVILGEVLERVTGRRFSDLLADNICRPLGRPDLHVGLPESEDFRVARLEEPAPTPLAPDPAAAPDWLGPLHDLMNRPSMWRSCQPATSGLVTARALARHYAALLPGGVDGVTLLRPETVEAACADQHLTLADGAPSPWGLGYNRYPQHAAPGAETPAFGHGGHGGSVGFADPSRGLAVALVKNRLGPHPAVDGLMAVIGPLAAG
jgi:CubicO group peptidase (beta-lactamase class C family)